jgi:hypothetical protein
MDDGSVYAPVFSRGSHVLDYWLAHAEGFRVKPLGLRVESVVACEPAGRAQALIVRSGVTGRRRSIPVAAIACVDPTAGVLMLDAPPPRPRRQLPRPSPAQLAAARATASRLGGVTHTTASRLAAGTRTTASRLGRSTGESAVVAAAWLRPRVVRAGRLALQLAQQAATRTREGIGWLAPRVAAHARSTGRDVSRVAAAGRRRR